VALQPMGGDYRSNVQMADEVSQILRHSNQWVETIDPMLTAIIQQGDTTITSHLQSFLANLPRLSQLAAHPAKLESSLGRSSRSNLSSWSYYGAPPNLSQPRYYNGRQWHFCTKCGGNGWWVCTHTNSTHRASDNDLDYSSMDRQRGGSHTSGSRYHRDSFDHRTRDSCQHSPCAKGNHPWGAPSGRSDRPSSPAPWRTPYEDPCDSRCSRSPPWRDRSPTPLTRETSAPRRSPFEDPRGRSRSRSPSRHDRLSLARRVLGPHSPTQFHGRTICLSWTVSMPFIGDEALAEDAAALPVCHPYPPQNSLPMKK